jgi:hypothetical protein
MIDDHIITVSYCPSCITSDIQSPYRLNLQVVISMENVEDSEGKEAAIESQVQEGALRRHKRSKKKLTAETSYEQLLGKSRRTFHTISRSYIERFILQRDGHNAAI